MSGKREDIWVKVQKLDGNTSVMPSTSTRSWLETPVGSVGSRRVGCPIRTTSLLAMSRPAWMDMGTSSSLRESVTTGGPIPREPAAVHLVCFVVSMSRMGYLKLVYHRRIPGLWRQRVRIPGEFRVASGAVSISMLNTLIVGVSCALLCVESERTKWMRARNRAPYCTNTRKYECPTCQISLFIRDDVMSCGAGTALYNHKIVWTREGYPGKSSRDAS